MLCASARKLPTLELHPALLDQEGLRPALCALVEDNFKSSGIRTLLEFEPAIGRMSPNVELTLYRLAQQALSNARSHSESKTAHVRVHGHNAANEITLVVEDDGKGLPGTGSAPSILRKQVPFVVQNGLGLSEMRERANRVGGRIEVDFLRRPDCHTSYHSIGVHRSAAHIRCVASLHCTTQPRREVAIEDWRGQVAGQELNCVLMAMIYFLQELRATPNIGNL